MSSPWTAPARRPAGVTFIALLALVIAFFSIVRGMLALLGTDAPSVNPTDLSGSSYGWLELVIGVAAALLGVGLLRGSALARLLLSALMVVRIVGALWVAFTFAGRGGLLVSALVGGLAVIVLLLLWNGRSDAFFTRV